MSSEKAAPTDSDTGEGVFQTLAESQLSGGPDKPDNECSCKPTALPMAVPAPGSLFSVPGAAPSIASAG